LKEDAKTKQFTKELTKSLEETLNLPEFKENLAHIMNLSQKFSTAWEKLKDGIKLLTKKIESGTEDLRGRCEVLDTQYTGKKKGSRNNERASFCLYSSNSLE